MMMQGGPSLRSVLGGTSSGRLLPRRQSTKVYMSAPVRATPRAGDRGVWGPPARTRRLQGCGGGGPCSAATPPAAPPPAPQVIALVEGLLTDEKTVAEALQYGDFGLGTLNHVRAPSAAAAHAACRVAPTALALAPMRCSCTHPPACIPAAAAGRGSGGAGWSGVPTGPHGRPAVGGARREGRGPCGICIACGERVRPAGTATPACVCVACQCLGHGAARPSAQPHACSPRRPAPRAPPSLHAPPPLPGADALHVPDRVAPRVRERQPGV